MEKIKQITYKILKWSEKYTKTDMLYLTKNGFWSIAGTAFATATGLTISIACANLISKDSFGTYKYMISLADIVALVSLTGISTAVTQAVARGFEGALAAGFRVLLKWNILMVMASLAGAVYYFINGDKTLAIAFLLIGALSPLAKGAGLYDAFLQGKKYFKTRTLYSIFRSTISTGLLIIAILLTNSPLIIFFVYLASQTMTATFLYLLTLKKYKPKADFDPRTIGYGKHLSVINIFTKLGSQLDNVLVFHYLGAVQLAIYAFASAPYSYIGQINSVIGDLAFPKMSGRSIQEIKRGILRKTLVLFLGLAVIAGVYILSAPYIFKFLFPRYPESVLFSQIMILSLLIPGTLIGQIFVTHMKKKQLYITRITISSLKILLLLVLLPFYGIWGAVAATLLADVANFVLYFVYFMRLKN